MVKKHDLYLKHDVVFNSPEMEFYLKKSQDIEFFTSLQFISTRKALISHTGCCACDAHITHDRCVSNKPREFRNTEA